MSISSLKCNDPVGLCHPFLFRVLTFFRKKHKIYGCDDKKESNYVIPSKGFFEYQYGKKKKYRQRDYFLNSLQLKWRKAFQLSKTVIGRHHEKVFKKCNTPAYQHKLYHGHILGVLFQVPIPCIGHEAVGNTKQ